MAAQLAAAQKSVATRQAYEADFQIFADWCEARALESLPAEPATITAFLAFEVARGRRPSTLGRRIAAIRFRHYSAGHPSPTGSEVVKATLAGIRRTLGRAPNRKSPATAGLVQAMSKSAAPTLIGARDRAIVLLGFAAALRRSELVALDVADVQVIEKGLLVSVRRSKTDQEADGAVVAIPRGIHHCPVEALQSWLQAGCIAGGPLFRAVDKAGRVCAARLSDRAVTTIVKRYAGQIGLDAKTFSAHSLRSGFLTSAAANGASIFKMMDVSRHKSIDTLRSYVRDAELFVNHAGGGLL